VQVLLRACLVIFLLVVLIFVPPQTNRLACWGVVLAYAIGSVVLGALLDPRRQEGPGWLWLAPFIDVAVLVTLAFLVDQVGASTWTDTLLEHGFFLIPVLAVTLLNARLVAAVSAPTVAAYLVTSLITGADDSEPLASVLLRSGVLAGLSAGAVLMSMVQRARVQTIADLAAERAALLAEMVDIEDRNGADWRRTCTTEHCSTSWPPGRTWSRPATATRSPSTGSTKRCWSPHDRCGAPSPGCIRPRSTPRE
jgi:two-component system NarL family sensor kinase